MHPNPAFRNGSPDRDRAFLRDRAFGTLAVNAEGGPLLSHVPFLLSEDGATVEMHLVRSNPILRVLPCDAVIAVAGPDGYVSPDWYDLPDQVPTWNYVAVHVRGRLERLPDEEMLPMLDRQSAAYETRLLPKTPWTTGKMTPDALRRMLRQIVPCRMIVRSIDATWKLNQNKPDAARRGAAQAIADGIGMELDALARLMRGE